MWIGKSPETYYRKFITTMTTLFTLRFVIYRPKGHHYYMAECVIGGPIPSIVFFLLVLYIVAQPFFFAVLVE